MKTPRSEAEPRELKGRPIAHPCDLRPTGSVCGPTGLRRVQSLKETPGTQGEQTRG